MDDRRAVPDGESRRKSPEPKRRRTLPSVEAEIAWARRVATAVESGTAAIQLDGKMVDRPVIAKAMRILARA